MNKKDLLEKIYNDTLAGSRSITKSQVEEIVLNVFRTISNVLELEKGVVNIGHFGKFYVKSYTLKNARNPKTGKKINSRVVSKVKFQASKSLKDRIN